MHKMILFVVGLLGLASIGRAQMSQTGQCETINLMESFVLTSFATGTWYEIGKETAQNADCSSLQFTNAAGTISVSNPSVVNNFLQTSTGTATHAAGTARLTLTLSSSTNPIDFWILASDYENYAIAINCVNSSPTLRTINVWQLGRSVNSYNTPAILTAANTALSAIGTSVSELTSIDHSTSACTQLPVIGAGQPVILEGQCNNAAISVVQNFDVQEFTGTWHEIRSYYSPNAVGTCARANYELVGSTVNVVNSQVLNQRLDTITGTATLIGNDQSGRLSVILNVQGVSIQQELLILGTDYTGYAVSYSCVNLPDNRRQVNSWILSKTKQITPEAEIEVNRIIASLVDLNDAYYIPTDQSDNGCFYFPVHQPGVPVTFPGQCDNTTAAVSNFNLGQFNGTWHEVEAYPKEQQTGSCVNHDFTGSGITTSLNLVSNQVVNQEAISASGSVTFESIDGSGKLILSMTTGGQTIQIPYWVLATDYSSYALVYSCVNVENNDYRRVYSWKLSRTQTLPAEATAPINAAMAAVQVLNEDYFEPIDQTEAGCFYFPEAQEDRPVIFPGQCDQTISVQANFDPVAYMGLWHEIESYPAPFQTGTCSNAYYTLVGGVVDVFNTQVINQELDTINGTAIIPDASQPAKLQVSFPVAGTEQTTTSDYWVLATDYRNYSLVYSCTNLPNNQRAVFSWKLSKTKQLTAAANEAINAAIANIQILDSRYYFQEDQTAAGCFYFPEHQEGVPVVFPGVCDNTIAAVPNFNLAGFLGTWHEVEAYPKEQQTGTCVNHEFTPGTTANWLNLVSNQVIDQILTSANGSVTLASNDGSGRLILSMTTGGQTIQFPYWVLATDYSSYALVYSCENINTDYRAVQSWKLSKTQSLPAAAITPINNAIAAVQVLDQRYYEDIDQSVDGCFYYPDITAGEPVILEGQCGTVTPVAGFQSAAFNGSWYEIARYASARQSGNCAASQFTAGAQNTFTLTQTIVYNERETVVTGTATLASDGSGTMTAILSDGAALTYTTTIHILDTDYTGFALLYSCENVAGTNTRQIYSWKLSRSQSGLSQAANDRISLVVASNVDLLESYYQTTGQTSADCFYYPVYVETPEVIVLPGTCPPVSGVPQFNPTAYLGEWYEVGRYPIASQFGTCPRAEYSLVDGVITIRNTMVVNETLIVLNGIGRLLNSVNNNGVFQVTFVDENGSESIGQYVILGTNYIGYSLVYSCRNLGDGTRQVYSWKLSRTPTLSAEANTAINNIISNTQGLLEEYYLPQSHTDQDCFYVPELVPGESVIFRGGCGQVTGMQGFDSSQYLGWWHEIERYPSDEVSGQCTSANFVQTSTSTIQVIEKDVYNGALNETTNIAVLSADGTITITRNGVASTYVVIGTDYNTYSLLYSCEEVSGLSTPHRRVWSAKHSKARTLTVAAEAAMAPLIEANPVLHQKLYESVSQSDSSCFYYRENPGEQVILSGQCNTTIPVQQNFDIHRFAGTWYQIERYPYPQVNNSSTCVGARYTVNGDSVTVLNWEVLGGVLNTREGTASVNGATLNVTLPAVGSAETVTMDLHILTTDYEDHALAYTCVNINDFQRRVGAFKLSRSRQLSNEGQYAIGTYIADKEELPQHYFISILHHDDCEEPSSAFLFKSSIIVMLVCVVIQLAM